MKSLAILIILNIILTYNLLGQSILRGTVSDKNGETLIGAAVYPKSKMSSGITTDIKGDYSLKLPETGTEIIVVSYIGYKTIEDTITISKGILMKNYILESSVKTIDVVEIKAKAAKNNDAQLDRMKILSVSTIDYISSETMKKTGDANVAAAVSRITGVSTNSSGLITVRGVGDRYVKTTINGSRIPTLDPFTNNIKLDIIPSSLVDNIIITKTASPDLPGDWAGAYISIETKDYPDTLTLNLETSVGYNMQSSFKDVLTSERSSTDWLGLDNGFRNRNNDNYVGFTKEPTTYQEFVALGLGDYFNSLGVTSNSPWSETYFKLGLIQLGLMGSAQMNDADAFISAKTQFNTLNYKGKAYDLINAAAVEYAKTFPNNWNTVTRKSPLAFSQSFSIGNQTTLFGKTLGYTIGFRYSNNIQYDPNSYKNKITASTIFDSTYSPARPILIDSTLYQKVSKETNSWGLLLYLSYKLNPNNSVSFMFMPNVNGVNNVREGNYRTRNEYGYYDNIIKYQFYESRKQFVYQLKSEHYIPKAKTKIEFFASYTNGKSDAPDYKIIMYEQNPPRTNYPIFLSTNKGTGRYFRYLTDNVLDTRISAELPISKKTDMVRKVKVGAAYIYNHIQNDNYFYQLSEGKGSSLITAANPDADPYGLDRFDIVTVIDPATPIPYRSVQEYYERVDHPSSHYFGNSSIISGFAMIEYAIIPALRFSGGLRIEKSKIFTDCNLFHTNGFAEDDPRRQFSAGENIGEVRILPGKLNKISYLPSINIIAKLNRNETSPINLRASFSQSIARPSIRELSDNAFYDYELNAVVHGNSKLKLVEILNYDLRFESYFKKGDNVSVNVFYKDFKNHVELINFAGTYLWLNNENRAWLIGVELEGKVNITKFFELRANFTIVNSKSSVNSSYTDNVGNVYTTGDKNITRSMFGQAPYVINSMLTFSTKNKKFSVSINYNLQGKKLILIGPNSAIPDIYELPRHLLDMKMTQKLGKHFGLSLKVQDILNASVNRAYVVDGRSILVFDSYKYGTNYVLSLSYKL